MQSSKVKVERGARAQVSKAIFYCPDLMFAFTGVVHVSKSISNIKIFEIPKLFLTEMKCRFPKLKWRSKNKKRSTKLFFTDPI